MKSMKCYYEIKGEGEENKITYNYTNYVRRLPINN